MTHNIWIPSFTHKIKINAETLREAITRAIQQGELKPGDKLPPQRILAWKLGLNPSTVAKVYKKIAEQGLVGGQMGRGTYVLEPSNKDLFDDVMDREVKSDDGIGLDLSINNPFYSNTVLDLMDQIDIYSLGLSRQTLRQYLSQSVLLRYKYNVIDWLDTQRDMHITPSQVLPIASCQYALLHTLDHFTQRGDVILVEKYTAPGIKLAIKHLGLRPFGVRCDEQGLCPQALRSAIKQTKAQVLVTIPSHQSPMATTQSHERRKQLANIIKQTDILCLEDDIYGCFDTPSPLFVHAPKNTVYLSGFSKVFSAGIRAAYIIASEEIIKDLGMMRHLSSWLLSSLDAAHVIAATEQHILPKISAAILANTIKNNQLLRHYRKEIHCLNSPHQWIHLDQDQRLYAQKNKILLADASHFSVSQQIQSDKVRFSMISQAFHPLQKTLSALFECKKTHINGSA